MSAALADHDEDVPPLHDAVKFSILNRAEFLRNQQHPLRSEGCATTIDHEQSPSSAELRILGYETVRELVVVLHGSRIGTTITKPLARASSEGCSLEVCEVTANHDAVRRHISRHITMERPHH